MTGHRVLTLSLYRHGMHFSSHSGSHNNPPWLRFWVSTPLGEDRFSAVALERKISEIQLKKTYKGMINRGCVLVVVWVGGYCDGQPRNTNSSCESMVSLYISYIKAFNRNWLIHDYMHYPYNVSVCFWGIFNIQSYYQQSILFWFKLKKRYKNGKYTK